MSGRPCWEMTSEDELRRDGRVAVVLNYRHDRTLAALAECAHDAERRGAPGYARSEWALGGLTVSWWRP